MKWTERSVWGRALLIRLSLAAIGLATLAIVFQHPLVIAITVVLAIPLTILYYGIACPRCGEYMFHPLHGALDPKSCPRCDLSTRERWRRERSAQVSRFDPQRRDRK